SHQLLAVARDAAGNATTSAAVTVTVDNIIDGSPPSVSITNPLNGATLNGTITLTATASDDVAVSGVQFLLDGANLGPEDPSDPYSFAWDTRTVANGTHTLAARARDAAGNVTTTVIPVTVSNAAPTGLVAAYGFNDGSGNTLRDSSGNSLNGTI